MSSIPEITDADMAFQANEAHTNEDSKPFWKQYKLFHAAFAQFCYCGAQVGIAGYVLCDAQANQTNASGLGISSTTLQKHDPTPARQLLPISWPEHRQPLRWAVLRV